jgi:hypothetical protein
MLRPEREIKYCCHPESKFNIGLYGENFLKLYYLKSQNHLPANNGRRVLVWSFTKCEVFCVVHKSKMTAIIGHSFNVGTYDSFSLIIE